MVKKHETFRKGRGQTAVVTTLFKDGRLCLDDFSDLLSVLVQNLSKKESYFWATSQA